MIQCIAEHSVDMSILPEKARILDLGCRNFIFANHMRDLGHYVTCVDIDDFPNEIYYQVAITDHDGRCGIKRSSDPQATSITKGDEIPCYTLESFSKYAGVEFWDLIKCDVEGSELGIIRSMKKPMATQISIEFHLHTHVYGDQEVFEMENRLINLGYRPLVHDKTKQHGLGPNYYDSLWVLAN